MKKILIADDEEYVRELIVTTINTGEYELIEATDGLEVLDLARKEAPDLLLLDIMMPGMDGFEVCDILKNDPKTSSIRIIILSACGQEPDKERGRKAGADDYFVKPFSPVELLDKIAKVVGE